MKNSIIEHVEKKHTKKDAPKFNIGDTVLVHVKIKEEGKTRIQVFEGIVIKKKGSGVGAMFTVRRTSYGEGVERTFPIHAPSIDKIVVKKKGSVRRSKLYYLRARKGKRSKVAEKTHSETPSSGTNALPRTEGA